MKKGTFRYIDKDKILPWLIEIEDKYGGVDVDYLIGLIEDGFFDWQQGSE